MRLFRAMLALVVTSAVVVSFGGTGELADAASMTTPTSEIGFVDPGTGEWHIRGPDGWVTSFYYGDPGDVPFVGDWDCDGVDTPGLYRQADGFVYLRNANSQGIADVQFFFGNPGDVPLAGDFNGDGCDTVSIYRPSEGRVFIINELGSDEDGLGAAELDYYFGDPDDQAFVGDFDGDGVDTVGLHRASTGFVYYRNAHRQGIADGEFSFGDPGDRFVAGDWTGDGTDTPGVFRPSDRRTYVRYANSAGTADRVVDMGGPTWIPIAGHFELPDIPLDERTWSIEVVDRAGDPGRFNDIAIDNEGRPVVSYGFPLGLSWHELRFARCADRTCSDAEINAIHGAMFESTSVAVPPVGDPVVAFHSVPNQGLLVAECLDSTCSSTSIDALVELWSPTRKYVEAEFTSTGVLMMTADNGGHPTLFQRSGDAWQERVLASGLWEHARPAFSIGDDDLADIAFPPAPVEITPDTELEFPTDLASCRDSACTFGLIEFRTVHVEYPVPPRADGTTVIGDAHPSVAHLGEGAIAAAVAWRDGPGLDLVVCLDEACDDATTSRVDATPSAGRFVDLEASAEGTAVLAWATHLGDVRVARCRDVACTSFETATVASLGTPGVEVSLTIDWTGTPLVAYYDPAQGALAVARLT